MRWRENAEQCYSRGLVSPFWKMRGFSHPVYSFPEKLSLLLLFLDSSQLYWDIIGMWHCVHLRYNYLIFIYIAKWLIITIRLVNTSISSHCYSFCLFVVVRTFKIYTLRNFQISSVINYRHHIVHYLLQTLRIL